jgi:hypothetical protein
MRKALKMYQKIIQLYCGLVAELKERFFRVYGVYIIKPGQYGHIVTLLSAVMLYGTTKPSKHIVDYAVLNTPGETMLKGDNRIICCIIMCVNPDTIITRH